MAKTQKSPRILFLLSSNIGSVFRVRMIVDTKMQETENTAIIRAPIEV